MEEPRSAENPENEPTAASADDEQPTPAPEADEPEAEDAPAETEAAEATDEIGEATAEEADEGPTVSVNVEETGPCARKLSFEVPVEMVTDEIDKSYAELRNTVVLKGFRKGHVPRHVLERRFGDDVLEGVKQAIVDEQFQAAIKGREMRLALSPEIDFDMMAFPGQKLELPDEPAEDADEQVKERFKELAARVEVPAGEPFTFEIDVEVVPDFTLDNYKGIEVERPAISVTEEDIEKAIDGLRLQRGQFSVVEDGDVEETDVPVVHAAALVDGEEVWRGEELGANIAGGTVAGISVPDLKKALVGAKPGESKSFKVTLPDDFQAEEHRGKEVELEVTIDAIRRFTRPELTDEWAEELGFDDVEDLREEVEDDLRRQREREADDAVQEGIADRLLQLTDFDVPEGLVDRMVEGARDRQRMALLYRGVAEDQIDGMLEDTAKDAREGVVRQCKLYFMYEKIAEQEKIFVTEEEIAQRIQAIALNYRRRPDEIEAELEASGRLSSLRQQMREEKVRDYLVQQANVSGVEAPEEPEPDTGAPADDEGDDE